MKKKKVLLLAFTVLMGSKAAMAQTNWTTNGNKLTATGKLGSTSATDVDLISNNQTRMTITAAGNLAITSDQTSIQFPVPGSSPKPMMYMFPSGFSNTSRMIIAHSPAYPDYGLKYSDNADQFDFISGGSSIFKINLTDKSTGVVGSFGVSGTSTFTGPSTFYGTSSFSTNMGIGTQAPKTLLHVLQGVSGITPYASSTITAESATDNFISLLAPTANKTGILFGTGVSNQDGAIVYNYPTVKSGMQFNTASHTRLTITSKGYVGIGTIAPATEFHVFHGEGAFSNHGLRIQNVNGHQWTFYVNSSNGELDLLRNNQYRGYWDPTDGDYNSYTQDSKAAQPAPNVLQKLMRVEVKQYGPDESGSTRFGIVPQEANKVFPEIVKHHEMDSSHTDFASISNRTATAIAIKAIQEQQLMIEELKKEVENLKAMMNSNSFTANSTLDKPSAPASLAYLKQNTPNPFNAVTTVAYYVPQTNGSAAIKLVSANGQLLKTFALTQTGNGQVRIDGSALPAGTYSCVLLVNGVKMDAKQMVVIK